MSFIQELKRRNVFRAGLAYLLIAWVVLQAADFGLDLIDAPNWIVQSLFLLATIGLPLTLLGAWVFEVTPEGIKRERDVSREHSITPQTRRRLDRVIIVLLALIIAAMGLQRLVDTSDTAPTPSATKVAEQTPISPSASKSIAVLPFINRSAEQSNEHFSDGVAEEILNDLSRIPTLKVTGRTSSFAFKDQNKDLREIGEALGVNHILEGSVRKDGKRIRVTAQLIKVDDGFNLWSETYDRELDDIFAVQDDISQAIVNALQLTLGEATLKSRSSLESLDIVSYEQFLLGRQKLRERNIASIEQAAGLFASINARSPDFADAWALRAVGTLLTVAGINSYGQRPFSEALPEAQGYMDKARSLAPDGDVVLAASGLLHYVQFEHDQARQELSRALALNPSLSNASNWLALVFLREGRIAENLALTLTLRERDPLYLPAVGRVAELYRLQDDVRSLRAYLASAQQHVGANHPVLLSHQAWLARREGQAAKGIRIIESAGAKGVPLSPLHQLELRDSYMSLGAFEQATNVSLAPLQWLPLALLGRREEMEQSAQRNLKETFEPFADYLQALAYQQDWSLMVRYLDTSWQDLDDLIKHLDLSFHGHMLAHLSVALARTGDPQRAAAYLQRLGEINERLAQQGVDDEWFHLSRARYAILKNDKEAALESLEQFAAKNGMLAPKAWAAEEELAFAPLRGTPRYEAMKADNLSRMNQQRALLELPPLRARPGQME